MIFLQFLKDHKTKVLPVGSLSVVARCKARAPFLNLDGSVISYSYCVKNLLLSKSLFVSLSSFLSKSLSFRNQNVSERSMYFLHNLNHVRSHRSRIIFKTTILHLSLIASTIATFYSLACLSQLSALFGSS